MAGDVLDALAVDIDLATLPQAFQLLVAGEGTLLVGADVFRSHGDSSCSLS
jgi:hypothetical protein